MNFYYEIDNSIDDEVSKKPKFVLNIKFIIAILAILFFVVLLILLIRNINPNRKYYQMEEEMVSSAKRYIQDSIASPILNEIYLDIFTLNIELDNTCNNISGVFYDGKTYKPYLKCEEYESKVVDNKNDKITLYGDEIIVLAKGIPFYDPGYKSLNNIEVLGEVGKTEGVYNIYYYDELESNYLTRKVVIINNEILKANYPEIVLNGDDVIYVKQGEVFTDEGVTAKDIIDGNILQKVIKNGEINTSIVGKQKISYSVTNSRGLTNTIERTVNVIDPNTMIYVDYVIEPSRKVNDYVVISLSIYGELFDHVILPSGEIVNNTTVNYKVIENGNYTFSVYDRVGNIITKEIDVDNIDKEPPTGTCDAIIYNNYTKIDVNQTSQKAISVYEYQVNNMSVKRMAIPSYKVNSTNISSVSVTVEDSIGNKNKIKCDVMQYNTWKTDYSKLFVYLKTNDNTVVKKYSIEDYLKGVVYLSLVDANFNRYTDSQLLELFKSFFVLKKAELFNTGKYNVYVKQLIFPITESKFCDVYNGCKQVGLGGKTFYITKNLDFNFDTDYQLSYDKLDDRLLTIMDKAYQDTKKEVVINKNFDDVLIKYNSSYTQITSGIKNIILSDILTNKNYQEIISTRFSNYKIYNISNYASKYSDALKSSSNYYWPIGSVYADYRGLFNGSPESTEIIYEYGASSVDNKIHDGMGIRGECGKTKVIASKDGRVTNIGYNSEYGDYVIITHDNNVSFLYGSLIKSSISVSIGSVVKKGQNIAYVGKTNGNCMLYLEVFLNNEIVNPSEYVSPNNPRPSSGDRIIYIEGGSVKRSVCLSLLASGFSIDATAGIMANMQRESDFKLAALGDGGTSVGLCQWHRGRYTNLSNYCGKNMYTTECQLNFMLHELKNQYTSTYNYLLSNNSAYEMANYFCFNYEIPAARITSCPSRGEVAKSVFVPYVLNDCN